MQSGQQAKSIEIAEDIQLKLEKLKYNPYVAYIGPASLTSDKKGDNRSTLRSILEWSRKRHERGDNFYSYKIPVLLNVSENSNSYWIHVEITVRPEHYTGYGIRVSYSLPGGLSESNKNAIQQLLESAISNRVDTNAGQGFFSINYLGAYAGPYTRLAFDVKETEQKRELSNTVSIQKAFESVNTPAIHSPTLIPTPNPAPVSVLSTVSAIPSSKYDKASGIHLADLFASDVAIKQCEIQQQDPTIHIDHITTDPVMMRIDFLETKNRLLKQHASTLTGIPNEIIDKAVIDAFVQAIKKNPQLQRSRNLQLIVNDRKKLPVETQTVLFNGLDQLPYLDLVGTTEDGDFYSDHEWQQKLVPVITRNTMLKVYNVDVHASDEDLWQLLVRHWYENAHEDHIYAIDPTVFRYYKMQTGEKAYQKALTNGPQRTNYYLVDMGQRFFEEFLKFLKYTKPRNFSYDRFTTNFAMFSRFSKELDRKQSRDNAAEAERYLKSITITAEQINLLGKYIDDIPFSDVTLEGVKLEDNVYPALCELLPKLGGKRIRSLGLHLPPESTGYKSEKNLEPEQYAKLASLIMDSKKSDQPITTFIRFTPSEKNYASDMEGIHLLDNAVANNRRLVKKRIRLASHKSEPIQLQIHKDDKYEKKQSVEEKIQPAKRNIVIRPSRKRTTVNHLQTQIQDQEQKQQQQQQQAEQEVQYQQMQEVEKQAIEGLIPLDGLIDSTTFPQLYEAELAQITAGVAPPQRVSAGELWKHVAGMRESQHNQIECMTPQAAKEIVKYWHCFRSGLNLDNLPDGFYLKKSQPLRKLVLCFDSYHIVENRNVSPLTLQLRPILQPRGSWPGNEEQFGLSKASEPCYSDVIHTLNQISQDQISLSSIQAEKAITQLMRYAENEDPETFRRIRQRFSDLLGNFSYKNFASLWPVLFEEGCLGIEAVLERLQQIKRVYGEAEYNQFESCFLDGIPDWSMVLRADFQENIDTLRGLTANEVLWWKKLTSQQNQNNNVMNRWISFPEQMQAYRYFCREFKRITRRNDLPVDCPFEGIENMSLSLERLLVILKNAVNVNDQLEHLVGLDLSSQGAFFASRYERFRHVTSDMDLTGLSKGGFHGAFYSAEYHHLKESRAQDSYPVMEVLLYRYLAQQTLTAPYDNYRRALNLTKEWLPGDRVSFVPLLAFGSTGERGAKVDIEKSTQFFIDIAKRTDQTVHGKYAEQKGKDRFIKQVADELVDWNTCRPPITLMDLGILAQTWSEKESTADAKLHFNALRKQVDRYREPWLKALDIRYHHQPRHSFADFNRVFDKHIAKVYDEKDAMLASKLSILLALIQVEPRDEKADAKSDVYTSLFSDIQTLNTRNRVLLHQLLDILANIDITPPKPTPSLVQMQRLVNDLLERVSTTKENISYEMILERTQSILTGCVFDISRPPLLLPSSTLAPLFKEQDISREMVERKLTTELKLKESKYDIEIKEQSIRLITQRLATTENSLRVIDSLKLVRDSRPSDLLETIKTLLNSTRIGSCPVEYIQGILSSLLSYYRQHQEYTFPYSILKEAFSHPALQNTVFLQLAGNEIVETLSYLLPLGQFNRQQKEKLLSLFITAKLNNAALRGNTLFTFVNRMAERYPACIDSLLGFLSSSAQSASFLTTLQNINQVIDQIDILPVAERSKILITLFSNAANTPLQYLNLMSDVLRVAEDKYEKSAARPAMSVSHSRKQIALLKIITVLGRVAGFTRVLLNKLSTEQSIETLENLAAVCLGPIEPPFEQLVQAINTRRLNEFIEQFETAPFGKRNDKKYFDSTRVTDTIHAIQDMSGTLSHSKQNQLYRWFTYVNALGHTHPILVPGADHPKPANALSRADILTLVQTYRRIVSDPAASPHDKLSARLSFLAIIREVLYRSAGEGKEIYPHSTQILSVLNTLMHGGNLISEIATGEGKSVVAMLSMAMMWLEGHTVDMCTSNSELARRDFMNGRAFFDYLGINSALINSRSPSTAYQHGGVNYADVSDLALFRARTQLSKDYKKEHKEEKVSCVIDEFDFTALDDGTVRRTAVSLDGSVPGRNSHYKEIYEAVNEFVRSDEFKYDPHHEELCGPPEKDIQNLRHFLEKSVLTPLQRARLRDGRITDKQLNTWIDSAADARHLREGTDYIVREEKHTVDNEEEHVSVARLLDNSRGRVSPNTQYSHGVQQFLHARLNKERIEKKRDIRPFLVETEMSAVAVSTSKAHIDYYGRHHGRVIGLTGTSGSLKEKAEQKTKYQAEIFHIPHHQTRHRQDRPPMIVRTAEEHKASILAEVKRHLRAHNPPQPILIVCKDVDASNEIHAYLQQNLNPAQRSNLQLYNASKTDVKESDIVDNAGVAGCITVSTLMLSRGVDILPRLEKKKESALHPAGLFTLVTYISPERTYDQIRGRSGRQGQVGETMLVAHFASQEKINDQAKIMASISQQQALQTQVSYQHRLQRECLDDIRSYFSNLFLELFHALPDDEMKRNALLNRWSAYLENIDLAWKDLCQNDTIRDKLTDYQDRIIEIAIRDWGFVAQSFVNVFAESKSELPIQLRTPTPGDVKADIDQLYKSRQQHHRHVTSSSLPLVMPDVDKIYYDLSLSSLSESKHSVTSTTQSLQKESLLLSTEIKSYEKSTLYVVKEDKLDVKHSLFEKQKEEKIEILWKRNCDKMLEQLKAYESSWFIAKDRRDNLKRLIHDVNDIIQEKLTASSYQRLFQTINSASLEAIRSDLEHDKHAFFKRNRNGSRYQTTLNEARKLIMEHQSVSSRPIIEAELSDIDQNMQTLRERLTDPCLRGSLRGRYDSLIHHLTQINPRLSLASKYDMVARLLENLTKEKANISRCDYDIWNGCEQLILTCHRTLSLMDEYNENKFYPRVPVIHHQGSPHPGVVVK